MQTNRKYTLDPKFNREVSNSTFMYDISPLHSVRQVKCISKKFHELYFLILFFGEIYVAKQLTGIAKLYGMMKLFNISVTNIEITGI